MPNTASCLDPQANEHRAHLISSLDDWRSGMGKKHQILARNIKSILVAFDPFNKYCIRARYGVVMRACVVSIHAFAHPLCRRSMIPYSSFLDCITMRDREIFNRLSSSKLKAANSKIEVLHLLLIELEKCSSMISLVCSSV